MVFLPLFSDGPGSLMDKTAVSSNFPNIYEISLKRQHNWLGIFVTMPPIQKTKQIKNKETL
ncbi:purine catabolism protein PucB [Neisseria sp. HMSC064F03]|nr:purine catabolism protein PucB [Neisseria sp. HMSC061H08]OHQ16204.1 purine catabolism protein PucB [Neisseria sp. HMSC064F03]